MIYDSLKHLADYRGISPALDTAIAYLQKLDLSALEVGGTTLPNGMRCLVSEASYREYEECLFETHRENIDLQVCLKGAEWIECCSPDGLEISSPYDPEGDCTLYAGDHVGAFIPLVPGMFTVFFPSDAHKPQIRSSEKTGLRLVLKVPLKPSKK